jgi:hypothetical protein
MGLIAGDIVSCLRAALDHLACCLTSTKDGIQNANASFPILSVDDTQTRRTFKKSLRGVPPEAVTIIESLQPYHHGNGYKATKLWRLHRLWNIDKHRQIPSNGVAVEVAVLYPKTVASPIRSTGQDGGVLRFPLAAKGDLHLKQPVQIEINFGDEFEGIYISASELLDLYEFIGKDIFPRFHRFFEDSVKGR